MGRTRVQRQKQALLVVVTLLAVGIGVVADATHLLRRSELQTVDARYSIRGTHKPPSDIVFVAISPEAEQELEADKLVARSPLPRKYDAQVLDHLRLAGAKTIAMDLEFIHETNPIEDNDLIEAVARAHGKVVLATANVGIHGETKIFGGSPRLLHQLGVTPAEVHLTLDSDASVRRFERQYSDLASFPVAAVQLFTAHPVLASTFENNQLPIDYAGPRETFRFISFAKVLRDDFPPGFFNGALVIVGASSPILQDLHPTPFSKYMAGPEIWANAAATLLEGVPLRFAPGPLNVALIVILGIVIPLGSLRLRQWRVLLGALALGILFTVAVQVAFDDGLIVSYVYPLLALALGTLGTLAVLYLSESIERARVHDLFSRFVPADVVDQVVASAGDNLRLGAVERECTVLFSDLRGFTSFSEKLPATRVIEVVNCYLNEMTEAILDAGGTLISYMGDGIMAVFGAPLEQPDHADRALRAAREMLDVRLARFNTWIAGQGHSHAFAMGVGLNSGPVMAGNIGSEQRVEYTALGDTTNTASRLEGMTKGSGHMLFVSDSTRQSMRSSPADLVLVGEFEVRGRTETMTVWTLDGGGQGLSDTPRVEGHTDRAADPEPQLGPADKLPR
jgi:adenylate cyclase